MLLIDLVVAAGVPLSHALSLQALLLNSEGPVFFNHHVSVCDDVGKPELTKTGYTFKHIILVIGFSVKLEVGSNCFSFWVLVANWLFILECLHKQGELSYLTQMTHYHDQLWHSP